MRIDRRLVLIGVMVIVLSMTMATQYATTQIGYSFSIVHPSDADIRFIASDNSSDDGIRVLRVSTNTSTNQYLSIELGDWAPGQMKNYTAAFGIVNEENFSVDITYLNMSGTNTDNIDIWLHHDRNLDYSGDAANEQVKVVEGGVALFTASSTVWSLGAGDGDTSTMSYDGSSQVSTPWDPESYGSHVRASRDDNNVDNSTADFVWVGISLNVPTGEALSPSSTGNIFVHFRATTDN